MDQSAEKVRMRLFVYGTLKKGYTNYERYMKLAVASRKAKFLGNATSRHPFPLVLRPMTRLPATRGPMLLNHHNSEASEWCCIEGEVYEVDQDVLEAMDILEGVNSGYYFRKDIPVLVHDDGVMTDTTCICYFYTVQENDSDLLDASPLISTYDDEAHDHYVAGPINYDIIKLIMPVQT